VVTRFRRPRYLSRRFTSIEQPFRALSRLLCREEAMRDHSRGGSSAKPTVPVPSWARRLVPPPATWTAESGFFSAMQLRRTLTADRVDADAIAPRAMPR
jgi:hypothetical protein